MVLQLFSHISGRIWGAFSQYVIGWGGGDQLRPARRASCVSEEKEIANALEFQPYLTSIGRNLSTCGTGAQRTSGQESGRAHSNHTRHLCKSGPGGHAICYHVGCADFKIKDKGDWPPWAFSPSRNWLFGSLKGYESLRFIISAY